MLPARRGDYRIDPTQEFIAVGVANIVSCFVGSYPVTGSFSRTAVNFQSGVKTPASGIVTGWVPRISFVFICGCYVTLWCHTGLSCNREVLTWQELCMVAHWSLPHALWSADSRSFTSVMLSEHWHFVLHNFTLSLWPPCLTTDPRIMICNSGNWWTSTSKVWYCTLPVWF